jgi:hypothetical protein
MTRPAGPVPGSRRGPDIVSGPARQVHVAVLKAFAATGQPPSQAEIERMIRAGVAEPDRIRAELTAADMLAFTAGGSVRAAYPFSPVPTSIEVSWAGGPHVYAMCAIDALGMSAMLGRPVTISAAEPGTSRGIMVAVDGDRARWTPRSAVVFAGTAGDADCPSADRCCGYINFFTTARTARSWARGHPEIAGTILRRDEALRVGIEQFGALLQLADGSPAAPEQ